jgi:hypothetical protein
MKLSAITTAVSFAADAVDDAAVAEPPFLLLDIPPYNVTRIVIEIFYFVCCESGYRVLTLCAAALSASNPPKESRSVQKQDRAGQ